VLVVLVAWAVVVAHLRLGPSSSAMTSTTDRAVPSSACEDRCANRPRPPPRVALVQGLGGLLGLVTPHYLGVERRSPSCQPSPSRTRLDTDTRNVALAVAPGLWCSSGSLVRAGWGRSRAIRFSGQAAAAQRRRTGIEPARGGTLPSPVLKSSGGSGPAVSSGAVFAGLSSESGDVRCCVVVAGNGASCLVPLTSR
jgi:hypothetical protein